MMPKQRRGIDAQLFKAATSITDADIRSCTDKYLREQEEVIGQCAGRADHKGDAGLAEAMWNLGDRYTTEIERRGQESNDATT